MNQSKSEETIFCEALEIPVEQRAEFLQHACAGNPELLDSVKGLLQLHDTEEDFLDTPAIGFVAESVDEKTGDRIGSYVLECQIGEGGFGVVWQANQLEPIKRRVALKIVKLGMDSESIVERFNDERQTLALMNHPNIATVLDAGVTDGGRPYFAMELVDGKSLDRFCDENQLSLTDTLEILVTVCRAVQHAHQKGIVHRDLKPTNILIASNDGHVVPKVIDFGIATAIQNKDILDKDAKGEGGLAGTPQYMSPEQWQKQADIDTRSDIYSLGVVLFRLLTGTLPDFKDFADRRNTPIPSNTRKLNKSAIGFEIDEDLDWITNRAMSFDREHRYQSASELALDIERYLNGQVVFAHPGGTTYRFKKFIRRNRIVFGSGVMTVLAMIVAIVGSTWGMVHANQQRKVADEQTLAAQQNEKEAIRLKEIAEAEARKLRVVANVLKNMLPEANPFRGMKSGFQIREHLDQLVESVDALSSEPELEADVRITAARVYENLERYGWARLQYSKAHEIRVKELGEDHPKTLFCQVGIAQCNVQLHRLIAAENTIQKVLNNSEGIAPRVHMNALRTLRRIRDEQERYREAFEIAEQCLEMSKDSFKGEIFGHIHIANEYSISARKIGRFEEAEKIVRKSLKRLVHDHPDKKFVIANTQHRLAEILIDVEQFDEAKELAQSFVDIQSMTLGENDEYVVRGLIMLSEIHWLQDDLLVAEQLALEATERAETHPIDQFKIRSNAYRQLAKILTKLDLQRAADTWEKAIENRWQYQGSRGSIANDIIKQARIFEQLKSYEKAANRTARAIEILEHKKARISSLADAYNFHAQLLEQLGRSEAAEDYLEKAKQLTK